MVYNKKLNSSGYIIDIIKGTILGLIVTIILMLLFTILLTYSKLSEELIPLINSIIMILGIKTGSIFTSRKAYRNGWISGGLIGVTYFLIIFLLSVIFIKDFTLDKYTFLKGMIALVIGTIGGMIGINIK